MVRLTRRTSRDRREVNERARDDSRGIANTKTEVWKGSRAREGIATLGVVILGTANLRVVGGDDGVIHHKKGGAGISNGVNVGRLEIAIANLVAGTGKFPEALRVIDGGISNVSGIFAVINEAEVIGAGSSLLQVGGEQTLLQDTFGNGGVEESSLSLRLDCVLVSIVILVVKDNTDRC